MRCSLGSIIRSSIFLLATPVVSFAQPGMSQLDFDTDSAKKTKSEKAQAVRQQPSDVQNSNGKKPGGLTQLSDSVRPKPAKSDKKKRGVELLTTESLLERARREAAEESEE